MGELCPAEGCKEDFNIPIQKVRCSGAYFVCRYSNMLSLGGTKERLKIHMQSEDCVWMDCAECHDRSTPMLSLKTGL